MIGVIADDLSGAAEIGGVGLRHGLRAEIIVMNDVSGAEIPLSAAKKKKAGKAAVADKAGRWDLICIDTDSRSCTAEEAGRRAAAAARLLVDSGAHWIYKKVDSVLRGQVLPELEAILKQLHLKRALLAPANPRLGRAIVRGRYFIRGKPIHETEFARDPEHPRTSSKILELLARPRSFPVSVCAPHTRLPATGIAVGEARAVGDLEYWATRIKPEVLAAGGAEFFAALLRRKGRVATVPRAVAGNPATRELFVCGTASKSAREFLKGARACKTPVFSLPSELAWGADFSDPAKEVIARRAVSALNSQPRVILNIGLPSVREPAASRLLTQCLVQLAERVLRGQEVGHVYAEGGATAAALVRRIGWEHLTVLRELAPGVATLAVEGNDALRLTIKPGSYAWPAEVQKET
jgi:D-threonate/D-erythronate kinase